MQKFKLNLTDNAGTVIDQWHLGIAEDNEIDWDAEDAGKYDAFDQILTKSELAEYKNDVSSIDLDARILQAIARKV